MFSGIVESIGKVTEVSAEGNNVELSVESSFTDELKIDQSVAHNGVCLTVTAIEQPQYKVTAIKETLDKTNIGLLQPGDAVNLERSLKLGDRIDGHMVQGHVDQTAECTAIEDQDGSTLFTFQFKETPKQVIVEKGSVCIDGVSLTVVNAQANQFSVAIIPYTFENTIFHQLKTGDTVNIEFDIFGKYIAAYVDQLKS